jgi:hypothetical protein
MMRHERDNLPAGLQGGHIGVDYLKPQLTCL